MSDPFEQTLRERLGHLASAVPTEAEGGSLGATPGPTRVRATSWRSPIGSRSAAPVLVVVVAVLIVGALGMSGLTPRGDSGGDAPITATTTDGPFELTISSPHRTYRATDAIDVTATLRYLGPDAAIGIAHGLGVNDGPLGFGVEEPLFGSLRLSSVVREACRSSTLLRDQPIEAGFRKAGGFDGADPQASAFLAYMQDPVFRLPAGTWHVRVDAGFSIGSCGDPRRHAISAVIELKVADATGFVPTAVAPSPPVRPADLPIGDDTQDGPIQLTMTSPHRQVRAGDPITVTAGLANGGDAPVTTYGGPSGPITFSLRQVGGPVTLSSTIAPGCAPQVTLPVLEPLQVSFSTSGVLAGTDGDAGYWAAWQADPVLRLPAGTWEIRAEPAFSLAADCSTPAPNVHPSITIEVVP